MQKYSKLRIVPIFLVAILLSGCSFSGSTKKSEINLGDNQTVKTATEESSGKNNTTDSQPVQSPDLQKTEASAEVPSETATPPKNSSLATAAVPASTDKTQAVSTVPAFKITDRLVSWGSTAASGRTIDTIIIHSSYNAIGSDPHDLDDIINKEYKPNGVSPHYIISREGGVYRLVADQSIAYHAGVSKVPDGRTNVNDFSIGIEVVETQSESPNAAQYASLKSLLSYIKNEYKIKYVLGHSDIAPGRKDDPWNFDWGKIGKEK